MEEQLIGLEVAELAKAKGFVEICSGCYDVNGKLYSGMAHTNHMGKTIFSAPTQSLLQRWLREKHRVNLCIIPIYGGTKVEGKQTGWLCYTPYEDAAFNGLPSISLADYTYEEALERGLREVLKLI